MGQFKIHLLKTKLNSTVIFQNQYFVLLVDIVFFPPLHVSGSPAAVA